MEKSTQQNIKLGVFVITGILLFMAGMWMIGDKQHLFGNMVSVYSVFSNTNGLREGNNVRYSGINVGTVRNIQLVDDTTIVVEMSIQTDAVKHMKTDAKAAITSDGLVGNMIVNILHGSPKGLRVEKGDTLPSLSRVRTDEMLNTLSVTNENAALLTAELLKITRQISEGKGVVGALLRDTSITLDVKATISQIREASRKASVTLQRLDQTIASLDQKNTVIGFLKDTLTTNKLKKTTQNVQVASGQLRDVITQLESTVKNVNSTVSEIRDSKGVLHQLTKDQKMSGDVRQAITELDSTLIQLHSAGIRVNETLEALRYHWLLKGAFKKMEKEKVKE
ncbi:MAG: MlaD family protein [Saprospiraceae bacterium]|nr:MlaD family protein [Saprospiraceae bacterium]